MAERSFTEEVKKLRAGDGEICKGERDSCNHQDAPAVGS
jgi:hypothetical protein